MASACSRTHDRGPWIATGCLSLAIHALLAVSTRAQEVTVVPGNDPCMEVGALGERVQHWLQGRTVDPRLRVTVHTAADGPWFAVERSDEVVAERHFGGLPAGCEDQRDAIGLAIAMALEQSAETAAALSHEPSLPPPATTAPQLPRDRLHDESMTRDDRVRAHAAVSFFMGMLPVTTFALGAGVEAPIARSLRLSLTAIFAPTARVSLGSSHAEIQLAAGRALLCTPLGHADLVLEGCAGALAGVVFATGVDYAANTSTTLGLLSAQTRFALRWPAETVFSLRLALDGSLQIVRPRLLVEGAGVRARSAGFLGAATSLEAIVTW